MTTKNTILAIILLAILAIIAGLGLDIIKAETLTASRGLNRAVTTSTTLPGRLGRLDNLEAKRLVPNRLNGHVALNGRTLDVNVLELLDGSANLLNV
jgi:hypothetical protein